MPVTSGTTAGLLLRKISDGAVSDGADSDGADSDGADSDGADSDGADSDGADSDGADSDGADSDGADSDGASFSRASLAERMSSTSSRRSWMSGENSRASKVNLPPPLRSQLFSVSSG
nr:hypothetical protein [Lactococcus petauri]